MFVSSVINIDSQFILKRLWVNFIEGGNNSYNSCLHPACYGKRVFIADCLGIIKSLDIKTGKTLWITKISDVYPCLSGGLVVFDDCLYVASESTKLYALSVDDGSIVWQIDIVGEVLSDPVVYEEILLVHTNNGKLLALNKMDGGIKWVFNVENVPNFMVRGSSSPVVVLGMVIVGAHDGSISAISVMDGKLIWRQDFCALRKEISNIFPACRDIIVTPVIVDNVLYVLTCGGRFVGLNIISGEIVWSLNISSCKNILVKNSIIYLLDQDNCLFAIDVTNRIILWSQKVCLSTIVTTPVSLLNDYLFLGDSKGYLYCFGVHDGNLIAKHKINISGLLHVCVIVNDRLIVQTIDGIIFMLVMFII